ncbi:putative metalloprotease with PDZ domain [Siphonobacter sp. SORGH_AS 1065]|nr:putative metalloprotease with PDZ domain [Siphonobacter sp. SORGH_AS_1065]
MVFMEYNILSFINMLRFYKGIVSLLLLFFSNTIWAQSIAYTVRMENPQNHIYQVSFTYTGLTSSVLELKMPVWTPGYYQLMNYAKSVEGFEASDEAGKILPFEKSTPSTWQVRTGGSKTLKVKYQVRTGMSFVASNYLDENRAYISPAGLFLYPRGQLNQKVTVTFVPDSSWNPRIATGLDSLAGLPKTYIAPNFDILYDSPILIGKTEELVPFEVKGIPHYFVGYNMGEFDRVTFIIDLKKIVEQASQVIGDIPYKHYTFIAIGPGGGGIEHLNSTAVSFSGKQMNTRSGKLKMYNFLAHEYFHHYNVKRIRPIELGPFDYDQKNKTKMLWVSEGFTVYYEYLAVKRAGLMTDEELMKAFQKEIQSYENKPGHLFQSATQSSYETWEDGPFGRTGDEVNKTISYYNKGPVLGAMLDFAIRHETHNKKSLDDVMRLLYQQYYQKKQRGFTEDEFRKGCERIAGTSLQEIFDYASTTQEINYPKYFGYAGLAIDTTTKALAGGWLGINAATKGDSLLITNVEYESPAWKAGLRSKVAILEIDDQRPTALDAIWKDRKVGEMVKMKVWQNGKIKEITVTLGQKGTKDFTLSYLPQASPLQKEILQSWLGQ